MKPKTFFDIISPWIDKKYYAFTTFTILLALFILYHAFTKDRVKNETDLISIKGDLDDYSFTNGRKGSVMYYLWLNDYGCTFQIPANYLKFFNKGLFEFEANQKSEIEILISKAKANELQDDVKIFVLELRKGNSIYLNKKDTLQYEKSNSDISLPIGCIIAGLSYYFIRRFIWRP